MRVQGKGLAADVRAGKRRRKRPCRSAPAAPANVTLTFGRREVKEREEWRAITQWDPVTQDSAGRSINIELYRVELRAVDASGDPVETVGQAQTFYADGADFAVAAGSAPVDGRAREIDASPDEIHLPLSGLTVGIEASVHFLAAKKGSSAPTLRFAVWDTTASSEVVAKQKAPEQNRPTAVAVLRFTPEVGHSYQVRVSYATGTGTALLHQVQWHDTGEAAVWRDRVSADQDLRSSFWIVRPRTWYYQTRVSAGNRVDGRICWGPWSSWTTPVLPATGQTIGPPQVTGVALTFDRAESRRGSPWLAKVTWDETPWWIPPDGEAQEGAARYDLKLEVRPAGGSVATSVRRVSVLARDQDADTTAFYVFGHITRKREYRVAVRAVDIYGRRGAWSAFTAWLRPPKISGAVQNLVLRHPKPRLYVATWDEPADADAVIGYRVRWYRGAKPGTLVETQTTTDLRARYDVPKEDKGKQHYVEVRALYEASVEESDDPVETAEITEGEIWSDGLPPSSSPLPTVIGTARGLYVFWPPVPNEDDLTYEVHLGTDPQFAPSAATKVTEVQDTYALITSLPGGAA